MEGPHYLTSDYRGFLQELVRRFAVGYVNYSLTIYPEKKKDTWGRIDQKILSKYPIFTVSKYSRARRKKCHRLNAMMLRYDRFMVLQASKGTDETDILREERFEDIGRQYLNLQNLHGTLSFRIGRKEGRFTVFLCKDYVRELEAYYTEAAVKSALPGLQAEFAGFNRTVPSWSGIYVQKKRLQRLIVQHARRSGSKWSRDDFPISRMKKTYKIFP
jgi:hypothetical protein